MADVGTVALPEGARPHGLEALTSDRMLVTAEGLKELIVVEPLRRRMVSRIPLGSRGLSLSLSRGRPRETDLEARLRRQHRLGLRHRRRSADRKSDRRGPDGTGRGRGARSPGLRRTSSGSPIARPIRSRSSTRERSRLSRRCRQRSCRSASSSPPTVGSPSFRARQRGRRGVGRGPAQGGPPDFSLDREGAGSGGKFSARFGKSPTPGGDSRFSGEASLGRLDECRRRIGDRPRAVRGHGPHHRGPGAGRPRGEFSTRPTRTDPWRASPPPPRRDASTRSTRSAE